MLILNLGKKQSQKIFFFHTEMIYSSAFLPFFVVTIGIIRILKLIKSNHHVFKIIRSIV